VKREDKGNDEVTLQEEEEEVGGIWIRNWSRSKTERKTKKELK